MSDAIQDNLRFYQLLKWIQALDDGFGKLRGLEHQPPTVSNLGAYMIYFEAMSDRYPDDSGTDTFKFIKNHINMLLSKYRIGGFVTRPEKVKQTRENHLALRKGFASRGQRVYRYALTKSGRKAVPSLEDHFEKKNQIGHDHGVKETDTVIIPEPDRTWAVTSFSVSTVDLGGFDVS